MSPTPSNKPFPAGPFAIPSLILPAFQRFQLERWAAQAYPVAACGFLYGQVDGDSIAVVQARCAVASATGAVSATLDGADHEAGLAEARELGLHVVGTWCSRPDDAPVPSHEDRAHASAGWSHVYVAIDLHARREVRSWRFDGERFIEERLAT